MIATAIRLFYYRTPNRIIPLKSYYTYCVKFSLDKVSFDKYEFINNFNYYSTLKFIY